MAFAQHRRAPIEFTVSTLSAVAAAISVGVVIGVGIWAVLLNHGSLVTGIVLGLALGLPASVAVVFARRTIEQGGKRWLAGALGVLGVMVVAALLFALTQRDPGQASVGAFAGVATGLVSLAIGLTCWHRLGPTPEATTHERR